MIRALLISLLFCVTAKANDLFIYYNSTDTGAEYSRLKSHYEGLGFTVTGSTSTTVSSSDVSGKELVIDIAGNSNCGSTCRSVYDTYVSGGGKLIIAAPQGASNRQSNIESLIENKMSVGTMSYLSSTASSDLYWQSVATGDYASAVYDETGGTVLPAAGQLFQATGGTAMAINSSGSSWNSWYKWDYGSNGGTIIVAMGYDQFQTNLTYTSRMTAFLTTVAEEEGLYSSTPTYSSAPTSAQLQSRTDSRNITTNGNAIYVTQSGDNLDLDIVQYDNDNLIAGTSTTSSTIANASISGDDNTVSITQGNNAGSFSDDNVTLLDINGTNNSLTVRQGDNLDDVGGHRSSTNIVGNYNTLGILQENDGGVGSNGHYMEIDVAGNSNVMYMDQKDDGDKMLFMDVNGSSNDVDILQQGTGEHFLDITAGSNQTIDVNQDGSGSHAATIDMSGYSSTLDLDQTGSTDQTYSLTQICTNANGCGTTTINQN
jgi:hypothetical protein